MKNGKKILIIFVIIAVVALVVLANFAKKEYDKKIEETGLGDTLPYGFGKEATVILLAGQSNAAGCSRDLDQLPRGASQGG